MSAEFDQETADRLMDEAFAALEAGSPKTALKIGKSLEQMRYSGCFEIQALAHTDLGKRTQAIKVLRRGTEKCPDVWQLWQLLGNYLSEEDHFDEALAAYERGLNTSQPYVGSLCLNAAIALIRSGRPAEARDKILCVIEEPGFHTLEGGLRARMLAVELEALRLLDDREAAVRRFEVLGGQTFGDEAGEQLSTLCAEYARSLLELGRRDEARQAALQAARLHQQDKHALWVLRESRRPPESAATNHYKVMVAGDWPQGVGRERSFDGFFATYRVCADSKMGALGYVRELQPDGVANLRIEEIELIETTHDPKGVYHCGSYIFYREDD